jgi:hypothetical protein
MAGIDSFTQLLLHGDGQDGSTSFPDDSTYGRKISVVGTPKVSSVQSKYGGASVYFDGSASYLSVPAGGTYDICNPGSSSFTVDCWVYFSSNTRQGIYCSGLDYSFGFLFSTGGLRKISIYASSTGTSWNVMATAGTIALSLGEWHHVAIVRDGDVWRSYIDGVKDLDVTAAGTIYGSVTYARVGIWATGAYVMSVGYIEELRVSNTVRYTANFTPNSAPYSNDVTPPSAPSATEVVTAVGKTYSLANWTQPTTDFFYCELRRTVSGVYEYLNNVSGIATWQTTQGTPWQIREGTGASGVSPASSFLDESNTNVTAYHVRSVDVALNASAWTACAPVSGVYADAADVRYGVDRGDGTAGTCYVPTASQTLSGVAVDATTGNVTLPIASNLRNGISCGVAGTSIAGTAAIPDAANVRSGIATDATTGALIVPSAADVRLSVPVDATTGTYSPMASAVFPAENLTRIEVGDYGPTGAEYAGAFDAEAWEAGRNSAPDLAKYLSGQTCKIANTTLSGTYAPDFPAVANVLDTDTVNGVAGTFNEIARNTDPGTANVASGVGYKIYDVSQTGTLVVGGGGGTPPATPTITAVDNGLGTGATVTITLGDASAVNTVYTASLSAMTWVSSGSRTGNGTVTLTLTPGNYWIQVKSVLGGTAFSSVIHVTVLSLASKIGYYRVISISREPGALNMSVTLEKIEKPIKPK